MSSRYLFGPITGSFAAANLGHVRQTQACLSFDATGANDLKVESQATWEAICSTFPLDVMFVAAGRAINPITKTNWEGTGVKPEVAVAADEALEKAHELAVKKILANAKDDDTRRLIQMDLDRSKERPKGKAAKEEK